MEDGPRLGACRWDTAKLETPAQAGAYVSVEQFLLPPTQEGVDSGMLMITAHVSPGSQPSCPTEDLALPPFT